MNNVFCINKKELKILWSGKQEDRLHKQINKFKDLLTLQEMFRQMEQDSGEFSEATTADTSKFSRVTANVEIGLALELADFYFPDAYPDICFEMKSGFSGVISSYDNLVENIESATHVDCSIKLEGRQFNFQIKRYPQSYCEYTNEAIIEFLGKTMKGYGDMNGTILIVLLQPEPDPKAFDKMDFKAIHAGLVAIKEKITFDEIDFIFNERNQQIFWHQVFPQCGHAKKPLVLSSDKYKKQQEELKDKTI